MQLPTDEGSVAYANREVGVPLSAICLYCSRGYAAPYRTGEVVSRGGTSLHYRKPKRGNSGENALHRREVGEDVFDTKVTV